MCGIVGYIGNRKASNVLMEGLSKLEYRGYDSAGLALLEAGSIHTERSVGKLINLKEQISSRNFTANIGIGHTRWATHGKPSFENAHPHCSEGLAIVHNGIIENYLELKTMLKEKGYIFHSETDTEVVAHLIKSNYDGDLKDAVQHSLRQIIGSYGLAVISMSEPDMLIIGRKDSPLVIGIGDGEMFAASDIPAVLSYTREFVFLEEGDLAVLKKDSFVIYDNDGKSVNREVRMIDWNPVMAEKAGYNHFMQKEIYEQPRAIIDTIRGNYSLENSSVSFPDFNIIKDAVKDLNRIVIVACGTSWHAGLIAKFYIEKFAKMPVEVDIASEFRYRSLVIDEKTLFVAITQSGETADTLSALRVAKKMGAKIMSVCNVVGSSISRESDSVIYTHAGPEIGVASTKAFTTQVISLFMFAMFLGQERKILSRDECGRYLAEVVRLPEVIENVLSKDDLILSLAKQFKDASDFLYLGRNVNFPVALEGALKLKEISYIHAEGYAAGEMKHGPIALIDKTLPVFVLCPKSSVYEKVASNVEEVKTRDGIVIAVVTEGDEGLKDICDYMIEIPDIIEELSVFPTVVATQLFSYHCAHLLGLDVDQPRNLAKSVTVE
ncbi:glucosamine/fructose-6-phosphate aminotransferase, isomerizing [Denitrovibrio acetiphilus DSM 12809]|uniref:Glutamine--fructose-6-phosphate aminotransferase [isomerizing] n=1 Tax=Denitrovibrio acetiphilus (strain DSM 12809 / NBRC 114555 / N2460) TaxID=522772 RepID=D4H2J5_DENA2|nr:glutamine--fructose-6-phosphate transaminase (isomerizing) [Denitrovibrio acetiphilus]ADD67056.1 glucosamine/fructose-6-phosphate aminotransferase, isomerizing [Denitrovibrio acetiphilus DSM 12809]